MKKRYLEVAQTLEQQIAGGSFLDSDLPSERELASKTGVSHMTARKAVMSLIERQVLRRGATGRLEICPRPQAASDGLNVALLLPNWPLEGFKWWIHALKEAAASRNALIATITYQHFNDPVLFSTLSGDYDLVLLHLSQITPLLELRLRQVAHKAGVFFLDATKLGVRQIEGVSPQSIGLLVEHLYERGHRKTAFFNFEPENQISRIRRRVWGELTAARGMSADFYDYPVRPFEDTCLRAHEITSRLLQRERPDYTAVFCNSVWSTRGMMRAAVDHGYRIGEDIAFCSFDDKTMARYNIPSLTVVDCADIRPLFERVLDDVEKGAGWRGDCLHYRTDNPMLFVGESSMQAARIARTETGAVRLTPVTAS